MRVPGAAVLLVLSSCAISANEGSPPNVIEGENWQRISLGTIPIEVPTEVDKCIDHDVESIEMQIRLACRPEGIHLWGTFAVGMRVEGDVQKSLYAMNQMLNTTAFGLMDCSYVSFLNKGSAAIASRLGERETPVRGAGLLAEMTCCMVDDGCRRVRCDLSLEPGILQEDLLLSDMRKRLAAQRERFEQEWAKLVGPSESAPVETTAIEIARVRQGIADAVGDGRLSVLSAYTQDHFAMNVNPLLPVNTPDDVGSVRRTDMKSRGARPTISARLRRGGGGNSGNSDAPESPPNVLDRQTLWKIHDAIVELFRALERISSLTVNIRVESRPESGATFSLEPVLYAPARIDGRTDADIHNIFRGKWNYRVEKPGHSTRQGQLDLVREDRRTLRCVFGESADSSAACDVR